MSEPVVHREVERKFRVTSDAVLPTFEGIDAIARAQSQPTFEMVATYHDTEALSLIRWGVTLRHRTGGGDEGWHLKLPVAGTEAGTRDEIHLPLASSPVGTVPAQLADIVAPLVRDAALVAVAVVRTRRTPVHLLGDDGTALVELVDDTVEVEQPDGTLVTRFREIELELIEHTEAGLTALDAASHAVLASGAALSSLSKAASALGARAAGPADVPVFERSRHPLAIDDLQAALADHVRRFLLADVGVRRNLPDSVHQMRVAARRLRSVLRTFDALLDHEWSLMLREELAWIAAELGAIRDTEVLRDRLHDHAGEMSETDCELVRTWVDTRLTQRLVAGRSSALAALRSDRHGWLVDDLVAAVREPRVTDEAFGPARKVLPEHVGAAWRSFAKSARKLELDSPGAQWHEVRIKAKRARYAVDAVAVSHGRRAAEFAAALAEVTELLGEQQDARIAQQEVRALAAQGADGPTGFALGLLHAIEGKHQETIRMTFIERWPVIVRAASRSGMV